MEEKLILFDDGRELNNLIVHGGKFHADDVTLAALILECINPECIITRTNMPDMGIEADDVIIADIGNEYDGYKFFDHHQREEFEEPKSALGLFWDTYGNESNHQYFQFDMFVKGINLTDTGATTEKDEYCIGISSMNPLWNESIDEDTAFMNAVELARKMIRSIANSDTDAINEVYDELNKRKELYEKAGEDAVVYLEEDASLIDVSPDYKILDLTGKFIPYSGYTRNHSEIIAAIFEGRNGSVNCMFTCRDNLFPEEWINNPPEDVVFIHKARFVCAFKDKESIVKWFKEAIQNGDKH